MGKITFLFKEKLSRFYALSLIILIPVLIIANGFWQISVYQKNMSLELSQKAQITANVLASSLNEATESPNLQSKVDLVKNSNRSIEQIDILKPSQNDFPIIATTNPGNIGIIIADNDFSKIYNNGQTIVKTFKDKESSNNKNYWLAAAPIKLDGQIIGILSLKINTSEVDALSRAAINQSLILLVFTVFVVFLLLINYFRFFEYFVKYRKIQEIDKMKDEFISVVSHEIKTPLATVKGYLDMMFEGLTGKFDDNTRNHLQKISANVNRLDLLINELLDVSRLEQGRMQFDMQPVDISKVVNGVLTEIGDQAKNKNLELEHIVSPELPPAFVDPDRLHQVFENLVGNAIKYTPKGKISIVYSLKNGKVLTTVKDTGIGMSIVDAKRLFERFYRIKNEKTMDISGTGLGLWISKAIIKRMNGEISFKSVEGQGSEFTLSLPFIKEKK